MMMLGAYLTYLMPTMNHIQSKPTLNATRPNATSQLLARAFCDVICSKRRIYQSIRTVLLALTSRLSARRRPAAAVTHGHLLGRADERRQCQAAARAHPQ